MDFSKTNNSFPEKSFVVFNAWKHHLDFLKRNISIYQSGNIPILLEELYVLGENRYIDIYTGDLSIQQIEEGIWNWLVAHNLQFSDKFKSWIKQQHKGYYEITLLDGSLWILREGVRNEQFVHIHPARYGDFRFRTKATLLKTVILCLVLKQSSLVISLDFVNEVRTEYLDLSPIKSLHTSKSLRRLFKLFDKQINFHQSVI